MDADKLNEAAEDIANRYGFNDFDKDSVDFGFKAGADWVLSQPLADRLTDEEKEKIKSLYKWATECTDDNEEAAVTQTVLENIFGKNYLTRNEYDRATSKESRFCDKTIAVYPKR